MREAAELHLIVMQQRDDMIKAVNRYANVSQLVTKAAEYLQQIRMLATEAKHLMSDMAQAEED
jgi:hypothetical protein